MLLSENRLEMVLFSEFSWGKGDARDVSGENKRKNKNETYQMGPTYHRKIGPEM